MHNFFAKTNIFLIFFYNTAFSSDVIKLRRPDHQKKAVLSGATLVKTTIFDRLKNSSPLLLENSPFNFSALLPELQIRIAAFTTPYSIGYLSRTCKSLHENLTFQTPQIWKIITHSCECISEKKMHELWMKAHLGAEHYPQEQRPLFAEIKQKISSCSYQTISYQYQDCDRMLCTVLRDQPLQWACYTGDTNQMNYMMNKEETPSADRIPALIHILIDREKINLIPLFCTRYALLLERPFMSEFKWGNFVATAAIRNHKMKSFECLVSFYKQYLNLFDDKGMTCLDYVLNCYSSLVNLCANEDIRLKFAKIIVRHGGTIARHAGLTHADMKATKQSIHL
jgi:hypothetical protein